MSKLHKLKTVTHALWVTVLISQNGSIIVVIDE